PLVISLVQDAHHIGMMQIRCGACLRGKPPDQRLVLAVFLSQYLDGNITVRLQTSRLVDVRHSAGADMFQNLISSSQNHSCLNQLRHLPSSHWAMTTAMLSRPP